jgi:hypothetical protein
MPVIDAHSAAAQGCRDPAAGRAHLAIVLVEKLICQNTHY